MSKLAYLVKGTPLNELDNSDRENLEDIHATMDESDGYAYLGDSYTDTMWDDSVQWTKTGYTRINFALVHKAMDDANPDMTGATDSSHVSVIDDDPVRWDNYHNSDTMGESVTSTNLHNVFPTVMILAMVSFGAFLGILDNVYMS